MFAVYIYGEIKNFNYITSICDGPCDHEREINQCKLCEPSP